MPPRWQIRAQRARASCNTGYNFCLQKSSLLTKPLQRLLRGALLEFVRLVGEGGEAGLEEVIDPGGAERPRQQAAEARREDLRRREPARHPDADATRARDEFTNRLLKVAGRDGLLATLVRSPLHEGVAEEARHLVMGEGARGLERRGAERDEVERGVLLRVAVERPRE